MTESYIERETCVLFSPPMRQPTCIGKPPTALVARFIFVAIFIVATSLFSLSGWSRGLWAPDEPRHAEVAAEMTRSGDFFTPRLNGEIYPDKPPPPFWIIAASMHVFGRTEWAARLPFAIASGMILAFLYSMSRRLFSIDIATTSTLILATSSQFIWLSQRVSLDVFQTLFCLLAIFAWLREASDEGSSLVNGLLFYGACGLGLSTKGPTGLLIPLAAAIGHAHATGALRKLGSRRFLIGVLLMLAIVAAWLVPAGLSNGGDYLREILGRKSFGRIGSEASHARPLWYYLHEFPLEFLPWSFALLFGLWLGWKQQLQASAGALSILWSWIGIPVLVLTFATGKRGNYLMPLFPAAAIVAALAVHHLDSNREVYRRRENLLMALMRLIAGLVALSGVAVIVIPSTRLLTDFDLAELTSKAPFAGAALLLVGALTLYRSRHGLVAQSRALAIGLLTCLPVIALTIFPIIDREKSDRELATRLRSLISSRTVSDQVRNSIAFLGHAPEATRFYSDLDCREMKSRDELVDSVTSGACELAVIDSKHWDKLPSIFRGTMAIHQLGSGRARRLLILEARP